jgi:Lrp/AsnC family transcriptional regulator, regulator for asnA, asnC and gidA
MIYPSFPVRVDIDYFGLLCYDFFRHASSRKPDVTEIDTIDLRIIELLQENGTLTHAFIAGELGISEATVRRRISRLRDEDAIRIVAVANPFILGYKIVAIVGVQTDKSLLPQIERALVAMPEVRFVGVTLGVYDVVLEAWFQSTDELLHFATVTLASIDGIRHSESFQILRLSKYTYDWGKSSDADSIHEFQ